MRRLELLVALALVMAGCVSARARTPGLDVTGRWTGIWYGYGIVDIPRQEPASADLTQRGDAGWGNLVLSGTNAAEGVPRAIRRAGTGGTRVNFEISGSDVKMTHEIGGDLFTIDFEVDGDTMDGRIRDADPPVRIVLMRQKPAPVAVAPAPPPQAAPEPAPQPPPPPPSVATAPTPPPAAPAPAPAPPEVARPVPREFVAVDDLKAIHFDFDRSDIRPDDARVLDTNAEFLKSHGDMQVMIEGHCDERGTNEYNLALGERRARTARDYLVSRGVAADRITPVSYGEERPICTESTEACWRQNRRAEFLIKPR